MRASSMRCGGGWPAVAGCCGACSGGAGHEARRGVREPREFDEVFAAIARQGVDALVATANQVNLANRRRIAEFALANRLPSSGFADSGSLLSYGYDIAEAHRRLAIYAAKILEGAVPGNLPWMQPTNYALTINLGTAAALGLAIPPSVLLRAEDVIR